MIISRAPLRISFFGGGTDFPEYFLENGGAVLATAIDKYSYVTVSPFHSHLFDYSMKVVYRKAETVKTVDEIEHPVYRECLRYCGFEKDVEVHTVADLPSFTGLGSSSSFTVSLLQALHAFKGEYIPPLQLAYEAIRIERHMLKESVGVQDQSTAAVGGFNVVEFRTESDIHFHPVLLRPERMEDFERHLFVVFTGLRRRAADIETKKVAGFGKNRAVLSRMRKMVDEGYEILVSGAPLSRFGALLDEAWQAKRTLESSVANAEIDELYRRGCNAGAWGGKLLGAGGGGFLLLFAAPECHQALAGAFPHHEKLGVKINASGAQVIFAG